MKILAFNGSPRKKGNTSTLIGKILEGAESAGAETSHIRLHEIDFKGCIGCLGCRKNPGKCMNEDGLSPYLEEMKTCDGIVVGSPIYMYHITGQMKGFVDRIYSLYIDLEDGGYETAIPPGKTYALVISQGDPDPERFKKSIRYLAGFTGSGHGLKEVGRIIHADSNQNPAQSDPGLLAEAFGIGEKLVRKE